MLSGSRVSGATRCTNVLLRESVMRLRWSSLMMLVGVCCLAHAVATAKDVRIVTWNVYKCRSADEVRARGEDFKAAFEVMKPDILLLQEVNSTEVIRTILRQAGEDPAKWHIAVSEFSPGWGVDWGDLEVAIVSRYPLSRVVEYDPEPDGNTVSKLPERPIEHDPKLPVAKVETNRGFLWAYIEPLKLTLISTHLKSSRGDGGAEDYPNAQQREFVAVAIAESVADDLRLFPECSTVVGGDMNVGCRDATKAGTSLTEDCLEAERGDRDGYDDTHAILCNGLVCGTRLKNLFTEHDAVHNTSYPRYPGSPIDNLLVAGAGADRFAAAEIVVYPPDSNGDTFGSDHRPVLTIYRADD